MSNPEPENERGVQLVTLRNLVGRVVSDAYRIDRVIGEGGMGIVYEATQIKLDRKVAIKVLKLDGPNADEAFGRFEREISILSNMSHPNIVRVLDSGRDGDLDIYYIAMDLVSGKPLGDLNDGYRFRPEFALEVVYQLCGALSQPHSEGILHRDLKPDNVILTPISDETVQARLVDFGIARAFEGDKKLTATGVVVGTPHYMAPELVREKGLDLRTDIYALGVMLHEMLSGTVPFDGSNFMQIGFKHVQEPVPSVGSKVEDFDHPDIEELVAQMMAKEVDARPESVSAVRRAIEQIIDENAFSRVRVDPDLPVEEALDPWRIPVDAEQSESESGLWLPQSTPDGNPTLEERSPRKAGAHDPLTTTSVEGAVSSKMPIVLAGVAVFLALVAVVVTVGLTINAQEQVPGPAEPPTAPLVEGMPDPEVLEIVPDEGSETAVAAGADAGQAPDAAASTATQPPEEPEVRPTKVDSKPKKSEKGESEGDGESEKFEEGWDWIEKPD